MKILNTLSGQKEEFVPLKNKKVNMFVCGPTVYDYIHIGNARTFVFFDVVAKYLKYKGYDLNYIQNITDIDNKIIERAEKEKSDPLEYAKKYTEIFKEDMKALGVTSPEYKNATDHIPEVIKQVQALLDKGSAYVIENDGIYFDLSTFPDYGKLSGRTAGMADDAVSRIDDSDKKRNRGDFALWKFKQDNDPSWPAPFGEGRPGWHIEDTAITESVFGPQYDIHGGGQDLIFPHHEAEIAQQESASGLKPFVKYWMHVGFLVNKEQKMSKSLGNFATAHELLEKYEPEVLRFYLLSNHYKSPLDYTENALIAAQAAIQRIYEAVNKLNNLNLSDDKDSDALLDSANESLNEMEKVMDDDFNTAKAFGIIFDTIKVLNKALLNQKTLTKDSAVEFRNFFSAVSGIFGIIPARGFLLPAEVQNLVEQRQKLRIEGNYQEADKIRAQIEEMGYKVDDTIYGPLTTPR
jgi:cysteinyl-tRNA synthetase